MVYAALFAALTAVGAAISIPIGPVPITLQVLFVLLAGAMLGARWGALSMVVYLLLGVIGLPVFAGGTSGLGVLFGPTGGYLFGFVLAAGVTGLLVDLREEKSLPWILPSMAAGLLVIYLLGVVWLSAQTGIGLERAVEVGMLPFLLVDFLKILVGAFIAARVDLSRV
jgi:biotin transport system substrate-specific component